MKFFFRWFILGFGLIASQALAQQNEIRLAVIGDSYTVGFGDSCNIGGNQCSQLPPAYGPNWVWYKSNGIPQTLMQPCNIYFGWPAKLIKMLNDSGKNATLVAYCMRNGMKTEDMAAENCGVTAAAGRPTHTILFSGINDRGAGVPSDTTKQWAGEIGRQFVSSGGSGKTIYLQGNGEIYPAYWQQSFQWNSFMRGVNTPCVAGHPDPLGYLTIARNLATNPYIQW